MKKFETFNSGAPDKERNHSYKLKFLNSVLLLDGTFTFLMGFIRWQAGTAMGMIDFGFAGLCLVFLLYLRRHPYKVEQMASVVLALTFVLFLAVYVMAPYNTMRLSLFFLLLTGAFFLKGRNAGRIWLYVILLSIVTVHVLPYFETGYSGIDIFSTCLYLVALFFVLENYQTFRESKTSGEGEQEVQRQTEQRWRHALEGSGDAVWDWTPETGEFHYSRRFAEILGYDDGEFGDHAEQFFRIIHPDDEIRVREELQDYLKRSAGHYVSEMRVECKDGSWKWLLCRGTAIRHDAAQLRIVGTFTDITLIKQHEKQLEHIAHFDALTGIPNRLLLADRLQQALAHSKRDGSILAVCYLDLDGFKFVNDTMGHEAGDKVLIEVTKRIKSSIREDDTVARLGGDEFAVLLLGLHAAEECSASLNRLLEAISQPIEIRNKLFEVSASIGVATYPSDDHDADTLLRHADQAMYTAKQSGKNRYYLYDAENDQRAHSSRIVAASQACNGEKRARTVLPAQSRYAFAPSGWGGSPDQMARPGTRPARAFRIPARNRGDYIGGRVGRLGSRNGADSARAMALRGIADGAEHQHLGAPSAGEGFRLEAEAKNAALSGSAERQPAGGSTGNGCIGGHTQSQRHHRALPQAGHQLRAG